MTVKISRLMHGLLQTEFLPSNVSGQPENQHASEAGIEREKIYLSSKVKIEEKRKKSGHTRARRPEINLEQPGRLRVAHLLALLGISHSTFYAGVKSGRYPGPDGKDGTIPYWNTVTIREYLAS
jgi:predicted DNA-binding transcriptional regulator AlpA